MTNRFCDTEIWSKDWFLNLNTKQKLLVKFLFDNCDCAGFYQISWNLLKVYFNDVDITIDDFKAIKQVRFIEDNLIFIEDFALFQCKVSSFDKLNPNNNAHKGVLKLLEKHKIFSPSAGASQGLASPIHGAQEKEKEKDNIFFINKRKEKEINKEKEKKKFLPPTLEEIKAYCIERKNNVDPKRFFDYYSVADWKDKDGKAVKNWKQKLISVWEAKTSKDPPNLPLTNEKGEINLHVYNPRL